MTSPLRALVETDMTVLTQSLEDWLRYSLRSGLLFGRLDEPLDDYGKRIIRAILSEIESPQLSALLDAQEGASADPRQAMRDLYAAAREQFFAEARSLPKTERERALAWSILMAIGEVSPDEGMTALRREMAPSHASTGSPQDHAGETKESTNE